MGEALEARAIHSPKKLENRRRVAEIKIKTGNGSLAFFINPYLPAKATAPS